MQSKRYSSLIYRIELFKADTQHIDRHDKLNASDKVSIQRKKWLSTPQSRIFLTQSTTGPSKRHICNFKHGILCKVHGDSFVGLLNFSCMYNRAFIYDILHLRVRTDLTLPFVIIMTGRPFQQQQCRRRGLLFSFNI